MATASLAGKTSVVTGGSSGIGAAAAEALAAEGSKVVVAARRQAEGESVVASIKKAGGEAAFVQTDVTQLDQVSRLMEAVIQKYGSLDILFNNAGIEGARLTPLVEESEENLRQIMEVNLIGAWYVMKAAIPIMASQGGGSIINTTSVAGLRGFGMFSSYVASKFALEGLSRSVAQEVAEAGIRVNTVAPGPITTDLLNRITGGDPSPFTNMTPMKRAGTAAEVAQAVVYLASCSTGYVTGSTLGVDGGMTA